MLSGAITADRVFAVEDRRSDPASPDSRARVDQVMQIVRPIAETHADSPAQVVIAWTLAQPGLTHALCGARNPDQARENAAAGHLRLTEAEITTISEAVDRHLTSAA